MPDTLGTILERAECAPPLFHADEVYRWPPESLEPWLNCGFLRPTTPARTLPCYNCGCGHLAGVVFLDDARGKHAYLPCPQYGPSEIDMDRLRRWEVDLGKLTEVISAELHCRGQVTELVPERLWQLGSACISGRRRDVFFARMLNHRDGQDVLSVYHIPGSGIVVVPSAMPTFSSGCQWALKTSQ